MRYLTLRWRILQYEVRLIHKQMQHMLTASIVFLGVALPALFYMLLMGIGAYLTIDNTYVEGALMALILLLLHSASVILFRQGVLANNYLYFTRSMSTSRYISAILSSGFSLLYSPVVLLFCLVLFSIPTEYWSSATHGFSFLSLLLLTNFTLTKKPEVLLPFIIGFLVLSAGIGALNAVWELELITSLQLSTLMLLSHFLLLALTRYSSAQYLHTNRIANPIARLWAEFASSQQLTFLLISVGCLIVISLSTYVGLRLPRYGEYVTYAGLQLIALNACFVQVSVNKQMNDYRYFYKQIIPNNKRLWYQHQLSLGLFILFSLITVVLHTLALHQLSIVSFIAAAITYTVAAFMLSISQKYLIITWIICLILTAGLMLII